MIICRRFKVFSCIAVVQPGKLTLHSDRVAGMMKGICGTCIWFKMIEYDYGECRKKPPVIIEKLVGGNSYANIFQASKSPLVSKSHWCSEFCLRESANGESD